MKQFLSAILVAFCLIAAPGCGTSPKKVVFVSVVSSRVTVASAWDGFRQQRLLGKVSDEQWTEGLKAITAYKLARSTAIQIAKTTKAEDPALDSALIAVSKAYDPLFKILVQYVPELANSK